MGSAEELREVARSTEAMVHIVGIQSKAGVTLKLKKGNKGTIRARPGYMATTPRN